MKKILITLLTIMLACSVIYAQEEESEKVTGASASARLSLLGLTPEISLIVNNFEVGVCAPIVSGNDYETGKQSFGTGVGAYLGFAQAPFTRGYKSGVGMQYLWLTNNYLKSTIFSKLFDSSLRGNESAHILSIYYRGTIKFNDLVGMTFRVALPVYAGFNATESINIINSQTGWACWLMCPCSFSLGIRFEI